MAEQTNREIVMDGFTMEDLLEEVEMQKELQERRNERRREFEIRADVLAFLDKKKYPNYMEARFDNDWLYSNDLPDGLDIPAKDWPIARRLIKQLKNRDIAEHWIVDDETVLTKPQFTGIPRNMVFDEREIHENWVPVQPTPPRITMDEINDLDLFAARRLKYSNVTLNDEKPIENVRGAETPTRNAVAQISSQINVQKECQQKCLNADHGLMTNILKLYHQTENCDEGLDLKKTPTQINLNKEYTQRDIDAASEVKTDILKVHSQTENCNTGLDDLESLLEGIPPYLPPDTKECKVDRALTKSTKILASKTAAKQKELEHKLHPETDCEDDKALTESNKTPVRKTLAERREELDELDSILKETEHLNQAVYTTHSDDTVDKGFRTDTPWTDELITAHSAGQIPTTKSFGEVDSSREISRRPNVPVDGRPKRGSKRHQRGCRPSPAAPDPQERPNNPDEVSAEVYRDIYNGTSDEHRLGGTHGGKDKKVEYVKTPVHRIEDKTEASDVESCQRKKNRKKRICQRAFKRESIVSDENHPATVDADVGKSQSGGVSGISDNRKDKKHDDEVSVQRDKGIHNQEEDIDSFQKNVKLSPWQIKKARRNRNTAVNSRTRRSGRGTSVTERVESPMLFPDPEPVGNTPPHSPTSRPQPSLNRRILNSLRNRLNRLIIKTKALCCCS